LNENDEVTYTVKIKVTLTIPPLETQHTTVDANAETLSSNGDEVARAIDVVAETVSLNAGEVSINGNDDDVVVAEESVLRRDKQATVLWTNDEGDGATAIYFSRRRRRAIQRRLRKTLNK
jgi:hypothetical protein